MGRRFHVPLVLESIRCRVVPLACLLLLLSLLLLLLPMAIMSSQSRRAPWGCGTCVLCFFVCSIGEEPCYPGRALRQSAHDSRETFLLAALGGKRGMASPSCTSRRVPPPSGFTSKAPWRRCMGRHPAQAAADTVALADCWCNAGRPFGRARMRVSQRLSVPGSRWRRALASPEDPPSFPGYNGGSPWEQGGNDTSSSFPAPGSGSSSRPASTKRARPSPSLSVVDGARRKGPAIASAASASASHGPTVRR